MEVGLKQSEIKLCVASFHKHSLPQIKSEREQVLLAGKKIEQILSLTGAIFNFGQNFS